MADTLTVVYVEDSERIRSIMRDMLQVVYGITVVEARTGAQGMSMVIAHQPHVVLLDSNLPDVDGLTILRKLRANPRTARIPVIMISAAVDQDKLALAAGADQFMAKPPDFDRLVEAIKTLAKRSSLPRLLDDDDDDSRALNRRRHEIGRLYEQSPEAIFPQLRMMDRSQWAVTLKRMLTDKSADSEVGLVVVAVAAWHSEDDAPFNELPGQRFFWQQVRHSVASTTTDDAKQQWRKLVPVAYALMNPPDRITSALRRYCVKSKERECRQWALRILLENEAEPAAEISARALRTDPEHEVRATAALVLAKLGGEQHVPLLTHALSDEVAGVREQAANALARIDSTIAVLALETALLDGASKTAQAAANGLATVGNDDAIDALTEAARKRSEPEVVQQVTHALGKIYEKNGDTRCHQELLTLQRHPDESVRQTASIYL